MVGLHKRLQLDVYQQLPVPLLAMQKPGLISPNKNNQFTVSFHVFTPEQSLWAFPNAQAHSTFTHPSLHQTPANAVSYPTSNYYHNLKLDGMNYLLMIDFGFGMFGAVGLAKIFHYLNISSGGLGRHITMIRRLFRHRIVRVSVYLQEGIFGITFLLVHMNITLQNLLDITNLILKLPNLDQKSLLWLCAGIVFFSLYKHLNASCYKTPVGWLFHGRSWHCQSLLINIT